MLECGYRQTQETRAVTLQESTALHMLILTFGIQFHINKAKGQCRIRAPYVPEKKLDFLQQQLTIKISVT